MPDIIGAGDPLIGRLMLFDALQMKFRTLKLRKDPNCPVCGNHPTITELIDYQAFCGIGAEPDYSGVEITVDGQRIATDSVEPTGRMLRSCSARSSFT